MTFSPFTRRIAASVLGAGGVLIGLAAPAVAYPGPGCTSADVTAVEAQVATAMAGYLFTHPDVNAFFTGLDGLAPADRRSQAQNYLAANPQTKAEIDAIRGPAFALRARCNIPADATHFGVI